jgi:hypothetical protein
MKNTLKPIAAESSANQPSLFHFLLSKLKMIGIFIPKVIK